MAWLKIANQAISLKTNIKIRDFQVGELYKLNIYCEYNLTKRLAIAEHIPHGTALVATIFMRMRELVRVEEVDVIQPRWNLNYEDFRKFKYTVNPNVMLHFVRQDENHCKTFFLHACK